MQSHASTEPAADVVWSIVGLPPEDAIGAVHVSFEDALTRSIAIGYPRESLRLWSGQIAQGHLELYRSTLDSCAIEWRSHAITLYDFARREVLSLLSQEAAAALPEERTNPSFWAPFFPLFGGVMVHSSAVVREAGAVLLLAPDEGGKTTAARTAPWQTILSDDQNVVRKGAGGFQVHSTPWSLLPGPPRSAPLRAFFRLEKAEHFEVSPLRSRDLATYLWQEHRGGFVLLPRPLRRAAFDLVCEVARAAPAFTMRLPKDYVDWEAVDRAIAAA